MSEVTNTSTRLRDALDGLTEALEHVDVVGEAGAVEEFIGAAYEAREALAAAPEPEWEYRVVRDDGALLQHPASLIEGLERVGWFAGAHIERRIPAGPWERTESHEEVMESYEEWRARVDARFEELLRGHQEPDGSYACDPEVILDYAILAMGAEGGSRDP